jgi:hypothetical protein
MMIFVVTGFWLLRKRNKELFMPVLIYSLINLYIVASWSCWWFGSCFGNRALIATYAALSLPLACFFEYVLSSKIKVIYITVFPLFIGLNIFQSWQMREGILDATNMSRAYYFSTFLQTSPPTSQQNRLLLQGKFSSGHDTFDDHDATTHSLNFAELKTYEDTNTNFIYDSLGHSGKKSLITGNGYLPSDSIAVSHRDITKKSYTWIKASVWVYSNSPADSLNAHFEIHMTHKNWIFKPVKYKIDNTNFKSGIWNKLEYYYLTPDDLRSTKDKVCVYFINNGKVILIDDLMLQSFEPIIDQSVF